jgi:hypothetical protein
MGNIIARGADCRIKRIAASICIFFTKKEDKRPVITLKDFWHKVAYEGPQIPIHYNIIP